MKTKTCKLHGKTDKQRVSQEDRQLHRQTDRQTDKWAGKGIKPTNKSIPTKSQFLCFTCTFTLSKNKPSLCTKYAKSSKTGLKISQKISPSATQCQAQPFSLAEKVDCSLTEK